MYLPQLLRPTGKFCAYWLKVLPFILLMLMGFLPLQVNSQGTTYPESSDQRVRYKVTIDMPKNYLSGILIMARTDGDQINASLINEFGISFLDFSYKETKGKVKLLNIMKKLNKWYIKRVLRSDLKEVLTVMRQGGNEYYDKRHKIRYTFTLIDDTEIDDTES